MLNGVGNVKESNDGTLMYISTDFNFKKKIKIQSSNFPALVCLLKYRSPNAKRVHLKVRETESNYKYAVMQGQKVVSSHNIY